MRQFLWNSAAYHLIFDPDRGNASHEDIELYIRILLAAVDLAKAKYGVPTLIPFMRSTDEYLRGTGFTNESIMARLAAGGADVVDVSLVKEEAGRGENRHSGRWTSDRAGEPAARGNAPGVYCTKHGACFACGRARTAELSRFREVFPTVCEVFHVKQLASPDPARCFT